MLARTLIFCSAILAVVMLADAADITRETILADREKRARQMEHVIEKTQKSISDSISGKKPLPDEKIESLKRRLEMYQKRMDELSRTLNDEEISQMIDQETLKSEL